MSAIVKKDGFEYAFDSRACATCRARCCTGDSGYIYLNKDEIKRIAKVLGLETGEFVSLYLFKKGYKYSIKELRYGDSFECVFYDRLSNGCKIYESRPSQCITFPFWDYYKTRVDELKEECIGIITEDENV